MSPRGAAPAPRTAHPILPDRAQNGTYGRGRRVSQTVGARTPLVHVGGQERLHQLVSPTTCSRRQTTPYLGLFSHRVTRAATARAANTITTRTTGPTSTRGTYCPSLAPARGAPREGHLMTRNGASPIPGSGTRQGGVYRSVLPNRCRAVRRVHLPG